MNIIRNTTKIVKQTNIELLISIFKELGQATRAEISAASGLSVATCGNILKELLVTGEIFEGELVEPGIGRPSRCYIYNANHSLALCISVLSDMNSNFLDYALVNLKGEIIEKESCKRDVVTFETIDNIIARLVSNHNAIRAIGIGIPGMVRDGFVKYSDTEALNGIAVKSLLVEKYGIEVLVENEMHLMVYGYYKNNPIFGDKSLAVLLAPENHYIGAGFIIDGHLLKGNSNLAGEINYLPFGFPRSELNRNANNKETFLPIIVKTVTSIIPIINPAYFVLTGSLFKPEMLEEIRKQCAETIPDEFLPEFLFQQDLEEDYLTGIISLTLDSLKSGIQLIRV